MIYDKNKVLSLTKKRWLDQQKRGTAPDFPPDGGYGSDDLDHQALFTILISSQPHRRLPAYLPQIKASLQLEEESLTSIVISLFFCLLVTAQDLVGN